jgi:hypothetical protein
LNQSSSQHESAFITLQGSLKHERQQLLDEQSKVSHLDAQLTKMSGDLKNKVFNVTQLEESLRLKTFSEEKMAKELG